MTALSPCCHAPVTLSCYDFFMESFRGPEGLPRWTVREKCAKRIRRRGVRVSAGLSKSI